MKHKNKENKILFVSSSGGHFEQLKMLKPLSEKYNSCVVTEKTDFSNRADYYLIATGLDDRLVLFKFLWNFILAIKIWCIEKPTYIVSTGTMIVFPFAFLAKITGSKVIFIETFARLHDGTRTGKIMYKIADLFIIQWEGLSNVYPNAVYGGSIY